MEEINLTIAAKLKGKKSDSEIKDLTQSYHKEIITSEGQVV